MARLEKLRTVKVTSPADALQNYLHNIDLNEYCLSSI